MKREDEVIKIMKTIKEILIECSETEFAALETKDKIRIFNLLWDTEFLRSFYRGPKECICDFCIPIRKGYEGKFGRKGLSDE